jgi:Spy/CpxP family protein refolding chaperone
MFGFLIGTASLIGLIYVLRGGRFGRFGGCGGHRGERRWGGGRHGGWRGGSVSGFVADSVDANEEQERAIHGAVREFREHLHKMKGTLRESRTEVARAIEADALDEVRLGELFAKHDDAIGELRKELVGALGRVHAVLDDRQRRRLGELIEQGPQFFGRRSRWA